MIVEPQHFEFLQLQRGGISDLRHDFPAWKEAYERSLAADYASIWPALPTRLRWILDVGGGLAGLSALINQMHGGGLEVAVLDGKACPARVTKHDVPYNNATLTAQFLRLNGVEHSIFWDANKFDRHAFRCLGPRYDLVLSTQAWCFHFEPEEYLSEIEDRVMRGSVIIVDVRRHRDDWMRELEDAFGPHKLLLQREKWLRCAWTVH